MSPIPEGFDTGPRPSQQSAAPEIPIDNGLPSGKYRNGNFNPTVQTDNGQDEDDGSYVNNKLTAPATHSVETSQRVRGRFESEGTPLEKDLSDRKRPTDTSANGINGRIAQQRSSTDHMPMRHPINVRQDALKYVKEPVIYESPSRMRERSPNRPTLDDIYYTRIHEIQSPAQFRPNPIPSNVSEDPPSPSHPPPLRRQSSVDVRHYSSVDQNGRERGINFTKRRVYFDDWDKHDRSGRSEKERSYAGRSYRVPIPASGTPRTRLRGPARKREDLDEPEEADYPEIFDRLSDTSMSATTNLLNLEQYVIKQIGEEIASHFEKRVVAEKKEEERQQQQIKQIQQDVEARTRQRIEDERQEAVLRKERADQERKRVEIEVRESIRKQAEAEEEDRKERARKSEEVTRLAQETLQQMVNEISERARERLLEDLRAQMQTYADGVLNSPSRGWRRAYEADDGTRQGPTATDFSRSAPSGSSPIAQSHRHFRPPSLRNRSSQRRSRSLVNAHSPQRRRTSPSSEDIRSPVASSLNDDDEDGAVPKTKSSRSRSNSGSVHSRIPPPAPAPPLGYEDRRNKLEDERERMRVIKEEIIEPIANIFFRLIKFPNARFDARRQPKYYPSYDEFEDGGYGDDESDFRRPRYHRRSRRQFRYTSSSSSSDQRSSISRQGGRSTWHEDPPTARFSHHRRDERQSETEESVARDVKRGEYRLVRANPAPAATYETAMLRVSSSPGRSQLESIEEDEDVIISYAGETGEEEVFEDAVETRMESSRVLNGELEVGGLNGGEDVPTEYESFDEADAMLEQLIER